MGCRLAPSPHPGKDFPVNLKLMMTQSQISCVLSDAGARIGLPGFGPRRGLTLVAPLVAGLSGVGLCGRPGRLQLAGCLKAPSALSTISDRMVLPARRRSPVRPADIGNPSMLPTPAARSCGTATPRCSRQRRAIDSVSWTERATPRKVPKNLLSRRLVATRQL